jgi:Signal transduction histidine kinase
MSGDLLLKSCDICRIVRQVVKQYSVLFIGSRLSFSMEPFVCRGVTDEKWLSFVIGQLLSNSLKYTHEGRICIYGADEKGRRTDGEAVFLVIEDTGIGIQKSDLPRIFERGFTGYNGRLDKKSTGIGLYLCRQILDRLGHTIEVHSKMGEGTKVTVGFRQDPQG